MATASPLVADILPPATARRPHPCRVIPIQAGPWAEFQSGMSAICPAAVAIYWETEGAASRRPALVRPGRVDQAYCTGRASRVWTRAAEAMAWAFLP